MLYLKVVNNFLKNRVCIIVYLFIYFNFLYTG